MLSVTEINFDSAFLKLARTVLETGREESPRDMKTLEVTPAHFTLLDPSDCAISFVHRKHPYRFMAMELVWILSGDTEPWIIDYMGKWADFLDTVNDKPRLMGAYGPRIRSYCGVDQLNYVVKELTRSPSSRRAVTTIRDPELDTLGYKDVPCTGEIQFMIRNGALDAYVTMRSNDLVRGTCTDVFVFCSIQCVLASILGAKVGKYNHYAKSLHIYEKDLPMVKRILEDSSRIVPPLPVPRFTPMGYSCLDQVYEDASYGKCLSWSRIVPEGKGYLTQLMSWVTSTLDSNPLKARSVK